MVVNPESSYIFFIYVNGIHEVLIHSVTVLHMDHANVIIGCTSITGASH